MIKMVKTKIIAEDFYSTPSFPKTLRVGVYDEYNTPLEGYLLVFTINGVHYTKEIDQWGEAELNINLPLGDYQCDLFFQAFDGYERCDKTITVHVVERYPVQITADGLIKNYDEAGQIKAQFTIYDGSVLSNYPIMFIINGMYYNRRTDDNGEASLNIRLPRGEYACKIISPMDEYFGYAEKTVIVKVLTSTHMDGTNITKMEDETAVYQCAVYDEIGRVQCDVRITVNGVTYVRHTEADGLAKLNIRLPAGEYDIIAEFAGDSVHTGSRVVNHISSKPYMQGISEYKNGKWIPSDNTGFMESRIQVKQWSPEAAEQLGGVIFWDDTCQKWHKDLPFTSYEIIETDPRIKTAKFTTSEYIDLTDGQVWVHISSPYHENFGGKILKNEFNKDNGLYTYQVQDGRRNYMNKERLKNTNTRVYELLQFLLLSEYDTTSPTPLETIANNINTERGRKLLSGLRPIEAYDIQNGILKQNWFDQQAERQLSYDSAMDKIMNYAHVDGCPVDVYFSPEGVCQIEPLDIHTWLKTGFKITHSDLASYKYGFDTTNIMTGVNFQTTDTTPVINPDTGQTINEELQKLGFYFGANIGMISPVTESVTTTTTGSTGTGTGVNNKGKTVVVAADINNGSDGEYLGTVCSTLENAGYSVINLGIGPGYFSGYDYSSSSAGKVGVYIMAASTVSVADGIDGSGSFDYYVFGIRGDIEGSEAVSKWDSKPWGQDSDCTSICNRWSGHTSAEIAQMCRDSGKGDMVNGSSPQELANNVLAAVNGESGGTTSTSTTEVINVAETYKKAQEEVVKYGNELLDFQIKLPLNHTMFKNLHTNQMLFTELPKDFKLGNLAELFKILPTYKINRGLGTEYQENRWYIKEQRIKCDSNGLFSTLTLTVLPTPYSAYTQALRSYREAYIQAYEQQNNTSSGGGATGTLKWSTGVTELDNLIKEAIAGKTDEYEMASAIHYKLRDAGIKYAYYYDFNYSNTAQRWNAKDSGLNCGDTAALTAEAMKAAGLEAYVSLCPGHYITVIKTSDGVHFSDLTGATGAYSSREFDEIWSGSSKCQNPYDYPY